MMLNSACDCLTFIDSTISCDIEKLAGIGNLEDIRE